MWKKITLFVIAIVIEANIIFSVCIASNSDTEHICDFSEATSIQDDTLKIKNPNILKYNIPKISTTDFFKLPMALSYKISPDGNYLAYLSTWENRLNVFIRPTEGGTPIRVTNSIDRDIQNFFWKGEKIFYLKDNDGDENFHIFTADTKNTKDIDITPFKDVKVSVIDILKESENEILVEMNKTNVNLFDVYRLNINTGELTREIKNFGNVVTWMTDINGVVRIAEVVDGVNISILYREKNDDGFIELIKCALSDIFIPEMITADGKGLYVLSNIGRDKCALVKYNFETNTQELIYENSEVDVAADVIIEPTSRTLLGVYCDIDKTEIVFLNNQFKDSINNAKSIFNVSNLFIANISEDLSKFILFSRSDVNPGSFYYYDSKKNIGFKLCDIMPWIDPNNMANMLPVSYKASDGLLIHGYLTLPNNKIPEALPVIIYPHGGPWERDYWGFYQEVQFLANRGYAVFQMNFRGSTGYGKAFTDAGDKQWGLKMQQDITDGVEWLIQKGIADANRIGIFGGSYGGYATLAGITFTPNLYAAAVDMCGPANIFTLFDTMPPYWIDIKQTCYQRIGDPVKDKDLLTKVSPVFHADNICTPLFVAQGANDPRVKKSESDQIVDALTKRGIYVEYMVKDNEGHGFMNIENQLDFYNAMENFFEKYLKP